MAQMTRWSRGCMCAGIVFLTLLSGGITQGLGEAATIVVTSLMDPGDGTCVPTECTLREAIAAAQAGDTIRFASRLLTKGPVAITLIAGELVITHDLRLTGPGAHRLTIRAGYHDRIMRIDSGVVSIVGVTIAHGYSAAGDGGGIRNAGTLTLYQSSVWRNQAGLQTCGDPEYRFCPAPDYDGYGGGIFNAGKLTLDQSTVSENWSGGAGGIHNQGTLILKQSTVSGNRSEYYEGGPTGLGGGLYNSGDTTIFNHSTIHDNTAEGQGGGIYNQGTLTLVQSTVSGNTANVGGGLYNKRKLKLDQSIVSGNAASIGGGLLNTGELTLHQ